MNNVCLQKEFISSFFQIYFFQFFSNSFFFNSFSILFQIPSIRNDLVNQICSLAINPEI